MEKMHFDPVRFIGHARCSEKGCPMPASWIVHDLLGKDVLCSFHCQQLRMAQASKVAPGFASLNVTGGTIGRFAGRRLHSTELDGTRELITVVDKDWFETPESYQTRVPKDEYPHVWHLASLGYPGRHIARILGFHKNQIRRVLLKNPEAYNANCSCGLPRTHQGWCVKRFKNSPLRQETVRLMHLKQTLVRMKASGISIESARESILQNSTETADYLPDTYFVRSKAKTLSSLMRA